MWVGWTSFTDSKSLDFLRCWESPTPSGSRPVLPLSECKHDHAVSISTFNPLVVQAPDSFPQHYSDLCELLLVALGDSLSSGRARDEASLRISRICCANSDARSHHITRQAHDARLRLERCWACMLLASLSVAYPRGPPRDRMHPLSHFLVQTPSLWARRSTFQNVHDDGKCTWEHDVFQLQVQRTLLGKGSRRLNPAVTRIKGSIGF